MDYSLHPRFIQLKEDLRNAVQDFIATGTKIMTEWADVNISLLLRDRCLRILNKALKILEGLTSYFSEVIYNPNWPSATPNLHALFLFKLYLSNTFIDSSEITDYFGIDANTIQSIATKILTNTNDDEKVSNTFKNINTSDANLNNEDEFNFISETLIAFDQILHLTTIDLWHAFTNKAKQTSAGINLNSKMAAIATQDATEKTAATLTKAAHLLQCSQEEKTLSNLRITNLEKSLRRQEQKTNEVSNIVKKQNRNISKNSSGSQQQGSLASPIKMTTTNRQLLVDLTEDEEDYTPTDRNKRKPNGNLSSPTPLKRNRNEKSVHWKKTEEIQHFNPLQPSLPFFGQQVHTGSLIQPQNVILTPSTNLFPPAPLPIPPPAPSHSLAPFGNWNPQSHLTATPTRNPFISHNQQNQMNQKLPTRLSQGNRGKKRH